MTTPVGSASSSNLFRQAKLICAVIFIQSGHAGLSMIAMFALNQGMSNYVFVVYRMAIASLIITPFAILLDRLISLSLSCGCVESLCIFSQ